MSPTVQVVRQGSEKWDAFPKIPQPKKNPGLPVLKGFKPWRVGAILESGAWLWGQNPSFSGCVDLSELQFPPP